MRAGGKLGGGGECSNGDGAVGVAAKRQQEPRVMGALRHLQQNGRGERNGGGGGSLQSSCSQKCLTLPTVLTLGRVAAVPLLVSTFYMDSQWAVTATTGIFIAAAITDWLDGYIARKMHMGTAFGAFLDPVADKLMVATTAILLCTRPLKVAVFDKLPWLLTVPSIAIIGREITMSAVREWAASQNNRVLEEMENSNPNGCSYYSPGYQRLQMARAGFLVPSGVALLYISSVLAVWSLAVYMRKIWRVLLK